jgi:hypothetical protein
LRTSKVCLQLHYRKHRSSNIFFPPYPPCEVKSRML